MLTPRRTAIGAATLCLLSIALQGQAQGTSLLAAFRQAGISEAPGSIPVFYVESEKERALGFQKSLQAGRDWYQKQLNVAVPVVMTVLDAPTYAKFKLTSPAARGIPPRNGDPWIVQMPGLDGADPDGNPLAALQGEAVLFHEYGHILAGRLGIDSRNWVLGELFANIFSGAYLLSERPDLHALVESRRASRTAPRYTALIDFDYLRERIDQESVGWMQLQTWSMGFALAQNERLSDLVPKLQKAFPASTATLDVAEAVITRLSRVSAGLASSFAAQYGRTTIPPAKPVACDSATSTRGNAGQLIVVNTTANPITMSPINVPKEGIILTIPANEFRSFPLEGALLQTSDGSCYVVREEPTVATFSGR